jgi:hypothetical protein
LGFSVENALVTRLKAEREVAQKTKILSDPNITGNASDCLKYAKHQLSGNQLISGVAKSLERLLLVGWCHRRQH